MLIFQVSQSSFPKLLLFDCHRTFFVAMYHRPVFSCHRPMYSFILFLMLVCSCAPPEQAFERNAAPSATPLSPPSMVYSIDRWANSSFQSSPDPSHLPTLAPMFILRSLMAEQGATPAAVGASSEAATSGNNTAPSPEVEMPAHEAGAEAMANTNAADSAPVSKTNVSSLTPATAVADGTILSRPMPTLTVPQQKPAASPLAAVPVQSAAFSSELDLQTSKQYETPSLPNSEKLL